jgi:hypothetical protein
VTDWAPVLSRAGDRKAQRKAAELAAAQSAKLRAGAPVTSWTTEAVPDGQIPGPQEWEQLAQHLRREVTSRISTLDRLLGALAGPNGDPIPPP